jgi:uncharacterized membrane protein
MLFNFWNAIDGSNFMATITLILLIIYPFFIYNWAKGLMGKNFGLMFTFLLMYFIVFVYQWLVFVPIILIFISTFGKDIAERVSKK